MRKGASSKRLIIDRWQSMDDDLTCMPTWERPGRSAARRGIFIEEPERVAEGGACTLARPLTASQVSSRLINVHALALCTASMVIDILSGFDGNARNPKEE